MRRVLNILGQYVKMIEFPRKPRGNACQGRIAPFGNQCRPASGIGKAKWFDSPIPQALADLAKCLGVADRLPHPFPPRTGHPEQAVADPNEMLPDD